MKYWKKPLKNDLEWISPYQNIGPKLKYVTFEWDEGGWNNKRLAMETMIVFAKLTGRILVMAPEQRMYLLNKNKNKKETGFNDYFSMDNIKKILNVLTMQEFKKKEALPGHGKFSNCSLPNNNTRLKGDDLYNYLEKCADFLPQIKQFDEFLVFGRDPYLTFNNFTENDKTKMLNFRGSTKKRKPILYDNKWQNYRHIHFKVNIKENYRLLIPFYILLHISDNKIDHMMKRLIRDYVHYKDEIFCIAEIIVKGLIKKGNGTFNAMHIRRGDFQYKRVRLKPKILYNNLKDVFNNNNLLYFATDEKNKTYFNIWNNNNYDLKFLDDYFDKAKLNKINPNWYGMIEQIIISHANILGVTWFSTFSSYSERMKGYLNDNNFNNNTIYFTTLPEKYEFQKKKWPGINYYAREYPVSFYNIDDI